MMRQIPHKSLIIYSLFILVVFLSACDKKQAAQTKSCPADKPYYPLCTHESHNNPASSSNTWLGDCEKTWELALQKAETHIAAEHPGEKRWTGVKNVR